MLGAVSFVVAEEVKAKEALEERLVSRTKGVALSYQASVNRGEQSSKEAERVRGHVVQLETHLADLQRDVATLVARMVAISDTALPPDVRIPSLAPQDEHIFVAGTASSDRDVFEFAKKLMEAELGEVLKDRPWLLSQFVDTEVRLFEDVTIQVVRALGGVNPGEQDNEGEGEAALSFQIRILVPTDSDQDSEEEE